MIKIGEKAHVRLVTLNRAYYYFIFGDSSSKSVDTNCVLLGLSTECWNLGVDMSASANVNMS